MPYIYFGVILISFIVIGGDSIKALGFRASSQGIRYAIIEKQDEGCTLCNHDSENRIVYPANVDDIAYKLAWIKAEVDRIIRQNPKIDIAAIKTNEYSIAEKAATRETAYIDAVCMLSLQEQNIPIQRFIYKQLYTSSSKVKEDAEAMVGKTALYWDAKIADAIIAACKVLS